MLPTIHICVVGAGLAGSECAYQLAKAGCRVTLIEMRPLKTTPAHHTDKPAELVCSNSLRGADVKNAVGLLKEEMSALGSLIMQSAYHAQVPAGGALAVDRDVFSDFVKARLLSFPQLIYCVDLVVGFERDTENLLVLCASGKKIVCDRVVVATGPLTDSLLADWIREKTGQEYLYFYDAIAPIVEADSIDMNVAFRGNRWGRGNEGRKDEGRGTRDDSRSTNHDSRSTIHDSRSTIHDSRSTIHDSRSTIHDSRAEGDYINCPMNREEYEVFIAAVKGAELVPVKEFDDPRFFDGCLPIEEMVRRGDDVLRFGPMKPVGLTAQSSKLKAERDEPPLSFQLSTLSCFRPHAVVQLRQDNLHDTLYNMVGFQTRMKYPDQERVFRMIPGLQGARFVRLGSLHRNTFLCSPVLLNDFCEFKNFQGLYFAGQMTGCEGYVESAALGLYVGLVLRQELVQNDRLNLPPQTTALGALVHHVLRADPNHYQPMNVNFGLFAPLEERCRKTAKKELLVARARHDLESWRPQGGN